MIPGGTLEFVDADLLASSSEIRRLSNYFYSVESDRGAPTAPAAVVSDIIRRLDDYRAALARAWAVDECDVTRELQRKARPTKRRKADDRR